MKSCELCKSPARIYCDSDQASLCWTCDRKVHAANFLVARHARTLLCRMCRSPTPWTASGEKLGPSVVAICEKCVDGKNKDDEESANEVEVNQVVPLRYTPPPAASSSSCGDYYTVSDSGLVKRKRENVADLCCEDDCLSVQKIQREVYAAESSEAIEGNRGTLYNFLPLSSEAMGEKVKNTAGMMAESGPVVRVCKGTRVTRLDLNSSGC